MADYKAPLRDMRFVLNEVFEVSRLWAQLPALADVVDAETAAAILEEAGKVTAGTIAPLNRPGDEEGCQWNAGAVSTPAGFPEAYRTYAEGGWVGVGGDPAYGGMGMPKVISAQVEELVNSANLSFGLYPMLTAGACLALNAHASDELEGQVPAEHVRRHLGRFHVPDRAACRHRPGHHPHQGRAAGRRLLQDQRDQDLHHRRRA